MIKVHCNAPRPDSKRKLRLQPASAVLVAGTMTLLLSSALLANDFTVTSSGDQGDGNPGNGFCATPGMFSACTLRAAVEESNALAGDDRILIGAGTITVASELLIEDSVSIEGAGAMATIIQSDGGVPNRLFHLNDATVDLALTDLTLRGGDAGFTTADGGALRSIGNLQVLRVWFDGTIGSSCGALRAMGPTTIRDSTFTANSAAGGGLFGGIGGALCVANGSETVVENTTFFGNSALEGGAIVVTHNNTHLTLVSSTLVDNIDRDTSASAGDSSAIDHLGTGDLTLNKNLIAGTCRYSEQAVVLSDGGNIESPGNTCLVGAPGDQPNRTRAQLHLGTLGDYGGSVPTMLPGTQSVAVDPPSVAVSCPLFDARGEPRVGTCDVGSVERQPEDPESGPLFSDGFESGNTLSWSFTS
jgi:CSLREA domain-containing protein